MLETDSMPRFSIRDLLLVTDFESDSESNGPQIFESGGATWVQNVERRGRLTILNVSLLEPKDKRVKPIGFVFDTKLPKMIGIKL